MTGMAPKPPTPRVPYYLLVTIFCLLAASLLTTGYLRNREYEKHYRTEVEHQLTAIADLKIKELVRWRQERFADAAMITCDSMLAGLGRQFLLNPGESGTNRQLQGLLDQFPHRLDYDQARLFDDQGETRLSAPTNLPPATPALQEKVGEVLQSGQPTLVDFYRNPKNQRIYLALLVPILPAGGGAETIGVLALRIDPNKYLYPFILHWPTPSSTGETLLVRRDGNEVLFLVELHFQKDAALQFRLPLTKTDTPPVMAVLGRTGIVEGVDYRGQPVIANIAPVPNSPWFLVARMNHSEMYSPARRHRVLIGGMVLALLFGAGALLALVWRTQNSRFYEERYRAAIALHKSQQLLIETEKMGKVGGWEFDIDSGGQTWTEETYRIHEVGLDYQPTVDKGIDFYPPPSRAAIERAVRRAIEEEEPFDLELTIVTAKGNSRHVHVIGKPDLPHRRVYGCFQDITEREEVEETLRLHSEIMKNMAEGVCLIRMADGVIVYVNPRFAKTFGYEPDELLGQDVAILNDPSQTPPQETKNAIITLLAATGEWHGEVANIKKDGTPFWGQANASIFDHPVFGQVMVAVHTDISERKRAEMEKEQFYKFFYTSSDLMAIADPNGAFLKINPAFFATLGYSEEELLTKPFIDFVHPEDKQATLEETARQQQSGYSLNFENRYLCKNGEVRWLSWRANYVPEEGITFATARDITGLKLITQALRQERETLQKIFDTIPVMITVYSPDLHSFTINKECERVLGYSNEEAQKIDLLAQCYPDASYRQTVIDFMRSLSPEWKDLTTKTKSGQEIDTTWTNIALADNTQIGIGLDNTARKLGEEQLARSLQEKTVMLREIHHRVKNNLQVVYSLLDLQAKGVADPEVRSKFEESRNRVMTMALIHEKLYQAKDLSSIDMREYLESLMADLAATYDRPDVSLVVAMTSLYLDITVGIPCGLIVNELVSNCFKYAFPDRRPGEIRVGIEKRASGDHLLTVADNGIGFPPGLDYKNTTSLGLQIVTVLSGQIHGTFELVAGAGTEFRIAFPATAKNKGKHRG